MDERKVAMISQPMNGIDDEVIKATKEKAEKYLRQHGYDIINTFFEDYTMAKDEVNPVVNIPISYLAKSIYEMSKCTAVYFCKGWENTRGCLIEHEVAKRYGLKLIYEE